MWATFASPTVVEHLKKPKNITLDALTEKEQMILSVIGDGSDDHQTAERLNLSPFTVNTHRRSWRSWVSITKASSCCKRCNRDTCT